MSRKYKFRNERSLYFVTFAVVNWINVFTRSEYKAILLEVFKYCQRNKELEIYGYCVMPNHVHMIIGSHQEPLAAIMRDLKGVSSKQLIKKIIEHPRESRREWMLDLTEQGG